MFHVISEVCGIATLSALFNYIFLVMLKPGKYLFHFFGEFSLTENDAPKATKLGYPGLFSGNSSSAPGR